MIAHHLKNPIAIVKGYVEALLAGDCGETNPAQKEYLNDALLNVKEMAKTINDLILCLVDLSEECLKKHGRSIPDTYKDTILACYEFVGDQALKIAPLVKYRNEMVHQYLKVNWQNIKTVKN